MIIALLAVVVWLLGLTVFVTLMTLGGMHRERRRRGEQMTREVPRQSAHLAEAGLLTAPRS